MDEKMRQGESRDAPAGQSVSSPDLSALLGSLLGNGGSAEGGGASSNAMREGIGAVLNDPQMMAKLPDMIEMLRPMMAGRTDGERSSRADAPQEKSVPAVASADKGRGCHDRRVALLRALRPYLNGRRQEAIDYILRMDQMGKLFRGG